jgi:hypothetical protein
MPHLIIVAGPSRGGKSAFAERMSQERDLPLISTDDYKHLPWGDVPIAIGEAVDKFDDAPGDIHISRHGDITSHASTVIVEGVRALSFVMHCSRAKGVKELYWVVAGPCDNDKAKGLESRQRAILANLRGELPDVVYVRDVTKYMNQNADDIRAAYEVDVCQARIGIKVGDE